MGRALLVLATPADRQKATHWVVKAPVGTRVEFKASKRTLPQNDMLWAILTEVSQQLDHGGKKYEPTQWKAIFLHAFGREISFLPSLDKKTFLPIELSSSDLSKDEMTDFIEFILKEGSERGVIFKDPKDTESGSAPEPVAEDRPPSVSAAPDDFPPLASSGDPSPTYLEWLRNVSRMLWAAANYKGDMAVLKAQKVAAMASYPKPDGCSQIVTGKAEAAYGYCRQIVLGELEKADGLAMVAGVVGCDQHEIGRAS